MTPAAAPLHGPQHLDRRARRRWLLPLVYILILAASHAVSHHPDAKPPGPSIDASAARRREFTAQLHERPVRMSYLEWGESRADEAGGDKSTAGPPPVILLHGSPGSAADFGKLAPLLARERRVIALDQLGFGESEPWPGDFSINANAHMVLQLLNQRRFRRAHVVGWSNGGGTALDLAGLAPDRLASLTLMASIGGQATEGSQSHFFEHAKYRVGLGASALAELIPHFGLLGPYRFRHAALRFFLDSDQRTLPPEMANIRTPTLILHGRHDFLVPAWAAERHHAMMPASRLVMLDASHFLPFLQAEESAGYLNEFFRRHDEPGVPPQTGKLDLAPAAPPRDIEHLTRPIGRRLTRTAWTGEVAMLAALSLFSPITAAVVGALFVQNLTLNFSVLVVGLAAGRLVRTGGSALLVCGGLRPGRLDDALQEDWERRLSGRPWRTGWLAALWTPLRREAGRALGTRGRISWRFAAAHVPGVAVAAFCTALMATLTVALLLPAARDGAGWVGVIAVLLLAAWAARLGPAIWTRVGRQRARAKLSRVCRREYWPAFVYYIPLAPYMVYLACRHRGATLPTCVNPGIEAGGGMIGESKHAIMKALSATGAPHPALLPTVLIPEHPDPGHRADQTARAAAGAGFESFPVILKPDSGQRGFGVKLVRSREEACAYFHVMTRAAIVQPFHPGPHECGILWIRCERTLRQRAAGGPAPTRHGFVYSITAKEFPRLIGDGRRTLEELVYGHRRFRRQAETFLARFAAQRSRTPAAGEELPLAISGNHCQGTLFRDGAEMLTPALDQAVDSLAAGFRGGHDGAGELDFGRFDVRYRTPDDLMAGRFSIIELNGATGESTNIYDPSRSIWWSYKVLLGQWRHLYELGAARRDLGAAPMNWRDLIREIRGHYRHRRGPSLAD